MGGGLQLSKSAKKMNKKIKKLKLGHKDEGAGNKYSHIEQLNKNKKENE